MRLKKVERGHRIRQKLNLAIFRLVARMKPPDVLLTLLYRSEYFGRPHTALVHAVMRGPSSWTVGERELFATFVSRLNQCPF